MKGKRSRAMISEEPDDTPPRTHTAELARLRRMSDARIEKAARADPINRPLSARELRLMERAVPDAKEQISLRIDQSVIKFFRDQGRGYQTRMNAVLKGYMQARKDSDLGRGDPRGGATA